MHSMDSKYRSDNIYIYISVCMYVCMYGYETAHLWRRVIAMKFGEGTEGWSTRVCRRAHGCGLW